MDKDNLFGALFGAFILIFTFLIFLVSGLAVPHRLLFFFILAGLMDLSIVFVSIALGHQAIYLVNAVRPGFLFSIPEYIRSFGFGILVLYALTGLYAVSSILAIFALTLFILSGSVAYVQNSVAAPKKAGKRRNSSK